MRVLISGGAGFIGSAVASELSRLSFDCVLLDNLSIQIHGERLQDSFSASSAQQVAELRIGDVRRAEDWITALEGITHVLHLAAETGTGQSMYAVGHYCDSNVQGTSVLLDLLSQAGHRVQKVVVASSRAVYGEGKARCEVHGAVYPYARRAEDVSRGDYAPRCPICGAFTEPLPTDEESQLRPSSVYAITKLTQEQLVLTVCGALGIGATALRYQNVYGPGQSLINPYTGILSIFSAALLDRREINVFEDGLESRDFVFIDDVVNATVAALLTHETDGTVVNVGSGERSTVLEVVDALADAFGVEPVCRVTGDFRLGDIRHNVADTSRMVSSLGVSPAWGLKDGIQSFANWAREELHKGLRGSRSYEDSLREIRERGLLRTSRGG